MQEDEAEADATRPRPKILALKPRWPRGFNIRACTTASCVPGVTQNYVIDNAGLSFLSANPTCATSKCSTTQRCRPMTHIGRSQHNRQNKCRTSRLL